ncbi:MAG: hypothetical protein Q8J85_00590 [Sulfuricurvum sp.]|nr:hypothetical protein [Sulfuricurvum sp.]MDP3022670.1 hypothetical protein [Sulfuricurvum sp.]
MAKITNKIDANYGALFNDNYGDMVFNPVSTRESNLRRILDVMLESTVHDIDDLDTSDYDIDAKLEHNNVGREWMEIIFDYPAYEDAINDALKENEDGIPQKPKFLMQIRDYYRRAKKDLQILPNCQDSIKENSTAILDKVKNYYMEFLLGRDELREHYDETNVQFLVAYGFVECKVLEKPLKA